MTFRWKTRFALLVFVVLISLQFAGAVEISSASTKVVAAKDSSALSKSVADYVCDGIDDQKKINAALIAAGSGGTVILKEGTFYTTANINVPASCTLEGAGPEKTILSMSGSGPIWSTRFGKDLVYSAHMDIRGGNNLLKGFTVTRFGWLYISSSNVRVEDVVVRDSGLSLQSGEARVGQMAAFYIDLNNRNLENIEFERCKAIRVGTNGWRADNLDDPNNGVASPQYFLRNVKYIDCEAHTVGRGQYPLPSSSNMYHGYEIFACGFDLQEFIQLDGCYMYNCIAIDSWLTGIHMEARNGWNIVIEDCYSYNSGWRRYNYEGIGSGRNFMDGRNAVYKNCYSSNAVAEGYGSYQGWNTRYEKCVDVGSKIGFYASGMSNAKYNNIVYVDCISKNAREYGFELSGCYDCQISGGYVENAKGDGTYLNSQSGTTYSSFDIRAFGRNSPNIINTGGVGNTFTTRWLSEPGVVTPTPTPTPVPTPTPTPTLTPTPTPTPVKPATPYVSHTIPCRIEAENYDRGGEGIAYHDSTPGNTGGVYRTDDVDVEQLSSEATPNVGFITAGEWLQYTVNVQTAGTYDVTFRVASPYVGKTFNLQVDGDDVCTVTIPNTGSFRKFTTMTTKVWLPAGSHALRLFFTDGDMNIDYMEFRSTATPTPTPVPTPTPTPTLTPTPTPVKPATPYVSHTIPCRIEAENYDRGGEGIAYHDSTPGNTGGVYRTDDVDVEQLSSEATPNVGFITAGEWLQYTVNVQTAGTYDVTFRVASPYVGKTFNLQVDGDDVCTVTIPNTGSFRKFTTVATKVWLPAGSHALRLFFTDGDMNIDYMEFKQRYYNH